MGYTPEYGGMDTAMAGAAAVFIIIYVLVIFLSVAFSIAAYILQGLGFSTVAERRGIRHSWLAWVPVGNLWILGSLSDQYQYLVKGKIKSRRKRMVALVIVTIVLYFVSMVSMMVSLFVGDMISPLAFIAAVGMVAAAISLTVLQYMCYYDYYRSCEKNNGALYLVLSIFVSVAIPFLVFACRKKDEGMPPRKQPAPAQPIVQTEPVQPPVAEVMPTEEPVTEEPVAEEIPAEETPVEETSGEETPAEETPTDE